MKNFELYVDGASEPRNPGGIISYGVVIIEGGRIVFKKGEVIEDPPKRTNNVGEYIALIEGLKALKNIAKNEECRITVFSDSRLLINQVLGFWKINSDVLFSLKKQVEELVNSFNKNQKISFRWIPREENMMADALSKEAYLNYMKKHPELVERYKNFFASEKQINFIKVLGGEIDDEIAKYMSKTMAGVIINDLKHRKRLIRKIF